MGNVELHFHKRKFKIGVWVAKSVLAIWIPLHNNTQHPCMRFSIDNSLGLFIMCILKSKWLEFLFGTISWLKYDSKLSLVSLGSFLPKPLEDLRRDLTVRGDVECKIQNNKVSKEIFPPQVIKIKRFTLLKGWFFKLSSYFKLTLPSRC